MSLFVHMNEHDETDENEISDYPGIYCFKVNPFRFSSLGLDEYSVRNISSIRFDLKKLLIRKIELIENLSEISKLKGLLKADESHGVFYKLSAEGKSRQSLSRKIRGMTDSEVLDYVILINKIGLFNIPVYVGITTRQTLKSRYFQHKKDYLDNLDKNTFGVRFRQSGLKWSDLVFCSCVEKNNINEDNFRLVEKHLQTVLQPVMSIR